MVAKLKEKIISDFELSSSQNSPCNSLHFPNHVLHGDGCFIWETKR